MYKIVAVILFLIPSCTSVDEKIPANISKLQNLKVYEFPKQPDTVSWEYERSLNLDNTDKDYLIGQIGSINFYKQNYIFISDPIKNCIHVFDWEGNYVKNLGRKGRGPGEFMQLSFVKVIDDKLHILDIVTYQLHLFSTEDLTFLRTTNIAPKKVSDIEELDGYLPRRFRIKSDGNLFIRFWRNYK